MFDLDIYISGDEMEDVYLHRRWNVIPEKGDLIYWQGSDGNVVSGQVKDRLFCTDDEGVLRVSLHCDVVDNNVAVSEDTAIDTL
jgi:hypothetical protein